MGFHIIYVFLLVIAMAFVSKQKGLLIGFIGLLWLFSFRTTDIPDTQIYMYMYDDPLGRMEVNELGFLMIGQLFKNLTNAEFTEFYMTVIGLCMIIWAFVTRKLLGKDSYLGFCFLLFLSFYGFFYFGVAFRNSLSELLLFIGISYYVMSEKKVALLVFVFFVILAFFIHRSSVAFLLLIPLIKQRFKVQTYYSFYLLCIIVWLIIGTIFARSFVGLFQQIEVLSKLENYSRSSEASPSILSLQILSNLFLSIAAIYSKQYIKEKYKHIYNCFLNINMVGLFAQSLLWSVPTSYRFYNMFFFYNFVILYLMIFENVKIKNNFGRKTLSLLVSIAYFVILIHSFDIMLIY